MWVRYTLSADEKIVEVNNHKYTFPKMCWLQITDPTLLRKVTDHPDVFEVADFDLMMLDGIHNVKCHGKLIHTNDPVSATQMSSSKYFALKARVENTWIFRICITDAKYKLTTALTRDTPTIGVYRLKGGWGDIVMSFSAARALKRQYKNSKVIYSCPLAFKELVDCDPEIEYMELNSFSKSSFDAFVNLTSPCIKHEISRQPNVDKNRTEIFCGECETSYSRYFKPCQPVNKVYLSWAKEFMRKFSRPIIGFVPESCAPIRSWGHFEIVSEMCSEQLRSTNLIFNSLGSYAWRRYEDKKIFGYTMGQVVALLSMCDIVVGVDTGPMHSAASLGVPTIWLFTHIDGAVRTKDYKNAVVIQDKECDRSPCWYMKPCDDGKTALCGENIKPARVFNTIMHCLNAERQCRTASIAI